MAMNRPPQHWPDAGFGSLRLWDSGTSWQALNPQPGIYDWSKLDRWLELSAENHVDVLSYLGVLRFGRPRYLDCKAVPTGPDNVLRPPIYGIGRTLFAPS
jgi:hypothetical protein